MYLAPEKIVAATAVKSTMLDRIISQLPANGGMKVKTAANSSAAFEQKMPMTAIICVTVLILPQMLAAITLPLSAAIMRMDVTRNSRNSITITTHAPQIFS